MINYEVLEKDLKSKKFSNSYVLCGVDEELLKEGVKKIIKPFIDKDTMDFNFVKFDGMKCTVDEIINASETLPFMGEKKVVVVYRAAFLSDKLDSANKKAYNEMKEYLKDVPSSTVLVMYYLFSDKRDTAKKNKNIMALDKITTVVSIDKLRRDGFSKRIEEYFKKNSGNINKINLRYLCEKLPMNLDISKNEVKKLTDYAKGREVTKKDIDLLIQNKSEDDVFDLVEFISNKKTEKAIDVLDELLFKADQHMLIITSIENQFKRLYDIKLGMESGKRLKDFIGEFRLPQFVIEKLIAQSNRFSLKGLNEILKLCLETEGRLKTSSNDKKTELELLLLNIAMVKR
ncbi:MAG: DNA polymerase III subunit delta [Clostridium chrysemydis]|uniref:DNA polymerase III subunit delta n=1 Tax=Clostridium TaxID=1485 RepID=UPI0021526E72|nr:DNA polymerase III subunit delta [Clostridium sp. LY3-2]MCR6513511.1 DNA polymerase III subunit delta [Clostridium sp. LY3-2]